jgi:hypothetical protein
MRRAKHAATRTMIRRSPHARQSLGRRREADLRTNVGQTVTRRVELNLHKPWFALYARIKPTLVMQGRGQPAQWGLGTWQVPSGEPVVVGVYLYNRLWRFGQAEFVLEPHHTAALVYQAPALPFLRGRIRLRTG